MGEKPAGTAPGRDEQYASPDQYCVRRVGDPSADVDPGLVDADHDAVFAAVDRAHLAEAMTHLKRKQAAMALVRRTGRTTVVTKGPA